MPSDNNSDAQDAAATPELLDVVTETGATYKLTREQWLTSVLAPGFQKAWNDPTRLEALVRGGIKDEFYEETVEAARRLTQIAKSEDMVDAMTYLGIALRKSGRPDEARQVLESAIQSYGPVGYVLVNLAYVADQQGDRRRAEELLWQALEVNPENQDALLALINFRKEDGEAGRAAVLERVAAMSNGWRAQLWQAHYALEAGDIQAAMAYYRAAMGRKNPLPGDAVLQIVGDLGKNGHAREAVELCGPLFDLQLHGPQSGFNLIKAYIEIGDAPHARRILESIHALRRSDLVPHLSFWENDLAKLELAQREYDSDAAKIHFIEVRVPLWATNDEAVRAALPTKTTPSPVIAFYCGSVARVDAPSETIKTEIPDLCGRLSRAIPLFLAEQVSLRTSANPVLMCLRMSNGGFVLFGKAATPEWTLTSRPDAAYAVALHIEATTPKMTCEIALVRASDHSVIATWQHELNQATFEPTLRTILDDLITDLAKAPDINARDAPPIFAPPIGWTLDKYVFGLGQALAVRSTLIDPLEGQQLISERSILLDLMSAADDAHTNLPARLLLFSTFEDEAARRPDIGREFFDRIELWHVKNPLPAERAPFVVPFLKRIRGLIAQDNLDI